MTTNCCASCAHASKPAETLLELGLNRRFFLVRCRFDLDKSLAMLDEYKVRDIRGSQYTTTLRWLAANRSGTRRTTLVTLSIARSRSRI